ncbi:MAG TPA: hypothetical protein VF821_25755 [Lentzea sp.]
MALIVGGVVMAGVFLPFTLTHGPTSYNIEHEILGWDVLRWGLVMGTVPEVLIGTGLWLLRGTIAGGRRVTSAALGVMSVAMVVFAAMNLAFGGIGPPFDLFFLAPASAVVAATTWMRGLARALLVALAAAYCTATALGLIPLETSDSFGGYRIFGLVAYAGVGVLWALFGALSGGHDQSRTRRAPSPS